jgi:ribosomal protein S18 acetylase RimI-like enzyme
MGLGTALVGMCARELLRTIDDAALWLTVASRNREAILFYDSLGFSEARTIEGYYGDDDAIVMVSEGVSALAARAPGPT